MLIDQMECKKRRSVNKKIMRIKERKKGRKRRKIGGRGSMYECMYSGAN